MWLVGMADVRCARRCNLDVVEAISLLMACALRANSPLGEDPGALLLISFCFAGCANLDAIDSTSP